MTNRREWIGSNREREENSRDDRHASFRGPTNLIANRRHYYSTQGTTVNTDNELQVGAYLLMTHRRISDQLLSDSQHDQLRQFSGFHYTPGSPAQLFALFHLLQVQFKVISLEYCQLRSWRNVGIFFLLDTTFCRKPRAALNEPRVKRTSVKRQHSRVNRFKHFLQRSVLRDYTRHIFVCLCMQLINDANRADSDVVYRVTPQVHRDSLKSAGDTCLGISSIFAGIFVILSIEMSRNEYKELHLVEKQIRSQRVDVQPYKIICCQWHLLKRFYELLLDFYKVPSLIE